MEDDKEVRSVQLLTFFVDSLERLEELIAFGATRQSRLLAL